MGELASRADVSRLLGRVAFGATKADLDFWTGRRYSSLVDHLLAVPNGGSAPPDATAARVASASVPEAGQLWWLNRMLTTPYPLEERMTLMWHDHFATARGEVDAGTLMVQNQTLRRHALGSFRDLLAAVVIDPAMLRWLDGNLNVKEAPNENLSREMLELFTLGTRPQVYTETDVREAARALTGWVVDATSARYVPERHDVDTKVLLGRTIENLGSTEYLAVVDAALAQPIAPRFIAYKLVQNLAYEPTSTNLLTDPDPLVEVVAAALRSSGWSIRAGLRAMLLSDQFRSADATASRQVVRQPIELAVHAAKVLGLPLIDHLPLLTALRSAGQVPFEPPNVGGWLLGPRWLNSSTYLGNYAVANELLGRRNSLIPVPLLRGMPPPSDVLGAGAQWAARCGLAALSPTTLTALRSVVSSGQGNQVELQDGIFLLISSSPDWQVM